MFFRDQLYGKANKGWWMIGAGTLQLVCLAFLSASISTVEYKTNDVTHHGQFMKCPAAGPPGCENMPDLVMLEVSKVASAIQYVIAVGLISYLIEFGILVLTKHAAIYLSPAMHHHIYNVVIVLSYIQMSCGFFGPLCCTWCLNDEMEDLDWGYSMFLHWIQFPFSLLSFIVVFLTPMYTKEEDFAGGDDDGQKIESTKF
ncbi:uncharacterized protein LOC142355685 [Convolutriloba macropyga]|uniref:uncharacterized protein LOC142355685 n=1 Tax=Convolutriloba macropyga TaxID=536237 RepID=UPI003F51E7CA